jgi:hypothetical protein
VGYGKGNILAIGQTGLFPRRGYNGRRFNAAKAAQHIVPQTDSRLVLGFPGANFGTLQADHRLPFRTNGIIIPPIFEKICAKVFTKTNFICIIIYISKNRGAEG